MSRKAIVEFTYNGTVHSVDCTMDEKMKDICARLAAKIGKDIKTVDFLFLEQPLDGELTFEQALGLKNKSAPGAYGKLVGNVAMGLGAS